MSRSGGAEALAFVALLVVLTFFFWPALSPDALFFTHDLGGSDLVHQNVPFRQVMAEALRRGELPFWTRDMATGFPLLSEGQVGALYPPNLLLLWLLPIAPAVNLFAILHFLLAGLSTALYARTLGLGVLASTFAALVFALCGFLVVHLKHLNILAAAAFAPLFFALIEWHFRARRPRWSAAGAALVTAAMILPGHPQAPYSTLLLGALYAAARACGLARRGEAVRAGRRLALLLAGVLLGLGLAAPQLLPTLEMHRESHRAGGMSWDEVTRYAYHPRHLITFLSPYHFGDPADDTWPKLAGEQERLWPGVRTVFWEITGYVGWIPLLLGLLALALSARGRLRRSPDAAHLEASALLLGGFALLSLLLVLGKFTPVHRIFHSFVPGFAFFRFPSRFLLYVDLFLALLAGIGLELASRRLRPRAALGAGLAATLLAVADLSWFGRHHNPVAEASRWLSPPPLAQLLAAEPAPYRVYTLESSGAWERANELAQGWRGSLEPYYALRNLPMASANLSDGIPSLEFYLPSFYPTRLDVTRDLPGPLPLRLLGVWNVKYVLSPIPLGDPLLELRRTFPGPLHLYENRVAKPRAFLAFRAQRHADLGSVRDALYSPNFDPAVVHVEDPDGRLPLPAGPRARSAPAREISQGGDFVEFEVESERAGVFFASELFYPGRSAEVDGEPVELFAANGVGVALALPPGKHRVTLRYRCRPFERGLRVAAASGLLLAALALWPAARVWPPAGRA
jgi:hypothetical protein